MIPPRQQSRLSGIETSLTLSSPDVAEPIYISDQDSPCGSGSSPNSAVATNVHQLVRRGPNVNKLSLHEVARERVEVISERMTVMPVELLEETKNDLRLILEGTGGSQNREDFMSLQNVVHARTDLTESVLIRAHRVNLEILVAINTGIQAFLHPNVKLPQSRLVEVFFYKRCRNIACQSDLPAEGCRCELCAARNGFCNQCMCGVCNKFDFEVNSCRWIGCDACVHWTHTDCAMHIGRIGMGSGQPEMMFKCLACNRTSKLLGWVKDIFQHCAHGWDRGTLMRELDLVSRIFRLSEEPKGRKLCWMCGDLVEKMKTGATASTACRTLMLFFQDIEVDSALNVPEAEESGNPVAPQEACSRIASVVQEAIKKMEVVCEEKLRTCKRARVVLEACDRELEDKARKVAEIKRERQVKEQQMEELESIIRLKQAEAEMFQLKASEAKQEAERLQSIALAKSEKAAAEQDYASMYLKRRLDEAEAEKHYLFQKIKLQEMPQVGSSSGGGGDVAVGASSSESPQMLMSKIQDLLKNVQN